MTKIIIARITDIQLNITAGRQYEVLSEIESPEIGLLYRVTSDAGKLTNLQAKNFRLPEDEFKDITVTSDLIDLHRKQTRHNRELITEALKDLLQLIERPTDQESSNVADIDDFLDDARGYLMAMMFHANSLRCVGLKPVVD